MKQSERKKVQSILENIRKQHNILESLPEKEVFALLEENQGTIIELGNYVEQNMGQTAPFIRMLEEYCELVYQMFQSMKKNNRLQAAVENERAGKKLEQAEDYYVKHLLYRKYEILFLPYKAAMWDSMESIYLAAVQNSKCRVSVMPVPYYLLEDGKKTAVYEGNRFPEGLPIVDAYQYKLKEERPDVIFIHNPYDGYNRVTRVEEQFYSSELIKYTSHLCYVPYDVVNENSFNETYCIVPGVRNAWKIFVQSEKLREIYAKYVGADKVVALGSPKIDKILKGRNGVTVPMQWEKVIGTKTVFLLNTHVSRIINEKTGAFTFLRKVAEFFEEHKDIVLIWRPHPLSESTALAMNRKIYEKYEAVIRQFKKIENVIYDDTPDMHCAIAVSDAYFGDGGSLLILYKVTGKPVYLLDSDVDNLKVTPAEQFSCANLTELEQEVCYGTGRACNTLFAINRKTKTVQYIRSILEENRMQENAYGYVVSTEEKIFMLPNFARHIAVVDKKTKEVHYLPNYYKKEDDLKCVSAIRQENKLVITPLFSGDPVLVLNLETEEIKKRELPEDNDNQRSFYYGQSCINNEKLYIPIRTENRILEITREEVISHKLEKINGGFMQCIFWDDKLWILPADGQYLLQCSKDFRQLNKIEYDEFIPMEDKDKTFLFYRMVLQKENLWLIPRNVPYFIKIEKNGKPTRIDIDHIEVIEYLRQHEQPFSEAVAVEDKIYFPPFMLTDFYVLDTKDNSLKKECFQTQHTEELVSQILECKGEKEYIYRSSLFGFSYFADLVSNKKDIYAKQRKNAVLDTFARNDGSAGKGIFDYVCNEIMDASEED